MIRNYLALAASIALVAGCGGNAEEEAAQAGCKALADANWSELDGRSDELEEDGDYANLRDNFFELLRPMLVASPDTAIGIEVMGQDQAVRKAEEAFAVAWSQCGSIEESMPAGSGPEYQDAWDEIGVRLYQIFAS